MLGITALRDTGLELASILKIRRVPNK